MSHIVGFGFRSRRELCVVFVATGVPKAQPCEPPRHVQLRKSKMQLEGAIPRFACHSSSSFHRNRIAPTLFGILLFRHTSNVGGPSGKATFRSACASIASLTTLAPGFLSGPAQTLKPNLSPGLTCFHTCAFGLGDVQQTKVSQNPIKTGISKRQLLSIALKNEISRNIVFAMAIIFLEKSIPVGTAPSLCTAAET
jgi:hypothetical protein